MDGWTFGSLFAGIGGFDLGFERAGMECRWQVEIDPYCQKVLAKHWPNVERYSDVRECGKHNLTAVDLICGGFPCQPHSLVGKQLGATDDRDLWPEMRRVIGELQPAWVVAENVPGIRSTILDTVLDDLEAMAYEVGALAVPACSVGAPHKRERVWILANHHARGRRENWQRGGMAGIPGYRAHDPMEIAQLCADVAHANGKPLVGLTEPRAERDPWATEPDVGRVANGVPFRVDRLKCLGNAVVPQVVEWIGRQIMGMANG